MKPMFMAVAALLLLSGSCARAASGWPFWDRYAARFITADGRVVDPDRNSMTTSEGQSYAMFFALVAGDVSSFERVRAWTQNNLAQGDLAQNLPSWSWGKGDGGSWQVLDQNSASDSDLWIAYSLIEAGELWQKPEYTRAGQGLLQQIAKQEVARLPHIGPVLMPGRVELFSSADHWVLNPSYMPLPLLFGVAQAAPAGPWKEMALALPGWLQLASPAGYAMDWVQYQNGHFSPGGTTPSQPDYGSYDAIRVYLWAGLTPKQTPGAAKILEIFSPMAHLMRQSTTPPERIGPDGTALSMASPPGFSAALGPFLWASGENAAAAAQQHLVQLDFDKQTGLLGAPPRYYDQNLALFAIGWEEQRFRFTPDGKLRVQWKK
jgi:endo-1,4-beta-D-glucanase Y